MVRKPKRAEKTRKAKKAREAGKAQKAKRADKARDAGRTSKKPGRGPKKKRWSILAYIAGDNNLSDAGLEDIRELCAVGASDQVHVGVEIDTYGEHTGSIRYEITAPDWTGKAYRTVIERLPEKDTGDPETLSSFLNWGIERYPAKDYLVVVWNHGAGFRSVRRDIGYDDFGSSLDMPEIEDAFTRAGIGAANKIGILGFDACLMNMIEIAHHFRDKVGLLVGSQQTEPGDGWPYDAVLKAAKSAASRTDLAKQIVKLYMRNYKELGVFDVTQSAIDCSKTEPVVKAMSDLGDLLVQRLPGYRRDLRRIRLLSQNFEMADYVDLINLMELLVKYLPDSAVKNASNAVAKAASGCIVSADKLGETVRDAHGVSVWFPGYDQLYFNYRSKYLALSFARKYRGWVRFLDAYYS
jgi:hypothetical protein